MGTLPRRNDTIYKEIESFEDYELTQCVAYEMAVRNENVISLLNSLGVNKYENHDDYIYLLLNANDTESKELLKYGIDFVNHIQYLFETKSSLEMMLEDKIVFCPSNVVLQDILTEHELFTIAHHEMDADNELELDTDFYTYYNNFKKRLPKYRNHLETISSKDSLKIIENALKRKHTIPVETHFSRPKLELPLTPLIRIDINLELPEKELFAYIKAIKKRYSAYNDKNIPNTPLELLGVQLKKADNLVYKQEGKYHKAKETFSKQQKLADMFYIYDCLQHGDTQRKIQNAIYNYYADKGIETITMDGATLKKYKDIAIDYIDNMRYKELVTGVKL